MERNRRTALIALAAAGVLWGLTVPLSKLSLGWLDGAWLAVGRFGIAAPLLALVARRELRRACRPAVLAWGALGYGFVILLQNAGIARTSVSHGSLIVGAVPALVALIGVSLGRARVSRRAWTGFGIALAGVGLIAGQAGSGATPAGDALVLASAILSAAFVVAQPGLLAGRDATAVTAVQMAAGGLAALPFALAARAPVAPATPAPVIAAVGLTLAGTLLPMALFAHGQARVVPELAGAFLNLEPLVGAGIGAVAFHDAFGSTQLGGAFAVLAGIALSALPGAARRTRGRLAAPEAPGRRAGTLQHHDPAAPHPRRERAARRAPAHRSPATRPLRTAPAMARTPVVRRRGYRVPVVRELPPEPPSL
jgi:O-acetylserine/cysteine efflux transporter